PASSRPTPGELPPPAPGPATSGQDAPRDPPGGPHGCSTSTERSPAPGRSARLRRRRDAPRRTRSWLEAAVELRLGEIRRCLAQDLVGLTQLAHLALERLHPRPLVRRQARAQPLVTLGPTHPVAQRLGRAPDLPGNRLDRRPLRTVRALVLQHHPHRPLPDFRGILHWLGHDSILSRVGASRNPGAVHAMNRNNFEKILGYAASVALVVVFFAFGPVMLARAVGIILAAGGFYSFLQGSIPYGIEGREPSGEFTGITAR